MSAQVIGERVFTDGVTRTVFEDERGQYVFTDDGGAGVYGIWLLADEPICINCNSA